MIPPASTRTGVAPISYALRDNGPTRLARRAPCARESPRPAAGSHGPRPPSSRSWPSATTLSPSWLPAPRTTEIAGRGAGVSLVPNRDAFLTASGEDSLPYLKGVQISLDRYTRRPRLGGGAHTTQTSRICRPAAVCRSILAFRGREPQILFSRYGGKSRACPTSLEARR